MASTSTNKQPLLVDRPLWNSVDLSERLVAETSNGIDLNGANSCAVVVDCSKTDGAMLDDVYSISRDVDEVIVDGENVSNYEIYLYISGATDVLRPAEAYFVGGWESDIQASGIKNFANMPKILRPTPKVGSVENETDTDGGFGRVIGTYYRALYIPKGRVLWAGAKKRTADDDGKRAPLIIVQGGYF